MGRVLIEPDGSIRIAWQADGYEAIHVRARFRSREELADYARGIADEALFDRTLAGLRVALRARYPGAFDLVTRTSPQGRPWSVIVDFHPPPGTPRPDLWQPRQRPSAATVAGVVAGPGHAMTHAASRGSCPDVPSGLMAPVTRACRLACRC